MSRFRPLPHPLFYTGELQQFVELIIVSSSEYGPSVSYSSANLAGRPMNYPDYGDHVDSYLLHSYGRWRELAPSYSAEFGLENVSEADNPPIDTFVVVCFERFVFPSAIGLYETYNPGAIERIWAYMEEGGWNLLWDRGDGWFEMWHQGPVGTSHVFMPTLRPMRKRTRVLRVEFNMRDHPNIYGIDGIMLIGATDNIPVQRLTEWAESTARARTKEPRLLPPQLVPSPADAGGINITDLPYEMLYEIFAHLDFNSLRSVEQVCDQFATVVSDARLYRVVNLRPFWHHINDDALQWLSDRCTGITKLNLSWCGMFSAFTEHQLSKFFLRHGATLTHLCMDDLGVRFALPFVLQLCPNMMELSMQNVFIDNFLYEESCCRKLVKLDLARAHLSIDTLMHLLLQNPGLQHLSLAGCERFERINITETIAQHNTRLVSLNLWKTRTLSATGLLPLLNCTQLQELDLGYSNFEECAEGTLARLVEVCPRLRRLVLAGFRGLHDDDLIAIARHSHELQYLDVMGCITLTNETVGAIFIGCPDLRLLEINYCPGVTIDCIGIWKRQYPHVRLMYTTHY